MPRRTVTAVRRNMTIDGKRVSWTETWNVPEDFSKEEENLFKEMCQNGMLHPREATQSIRALRK